MLLTMALLIAGMPAFRRTVESLAPSR